MLFGNVIFVFRSIILVCKSAIKAFRSVILALGASLFIWQLKGVFLDFNAYFSVKNMNCRSHFHFLHVCLALFVTLLPFYITRLNFCHLRSITRGERPTQLFTIPSSPIVIILINVKSLEKINQYRWFKINGREAAKKSFLMPLRGGEGSAIKGGKI